MKYKVVIQRPAADEIDAAFVYLAGEVSVDMATQWFNELDDRIATLDRMPARCPLAPENEYFADEIRHLIVPPYRVLFTVRGASVHVLHVRHTARQTLGE